MTLTPVSKVSFGFGTVAPVQARERIAFQLQMEQG